MRRALPAALLALAACAAPPGAGARRGLVAPAGDALAPPGAASDRRDLDGDGRDDCWRLTREDAGGVEETRLALQPACAGPPETLHITLPDAALLAAAPLPAAWRERPDQVLAVAALLAAPEQIRVLGRSSVVAAPPAGPAVTWIALRATSPPLPDTAPLEAVTAWRPLWVRGAPAVPQSQLVVLTEPSQVPLVAAFSAVPDPAPPPAAPAPFALLAWRTGPHGAPAEVAACPGWTVWSTGHALAAYDPARDATTWFYASAAAPHLGEASVLEVACAGDLVIFEPDRPPELRALAVVAPALGRLGTLPLAAGDAWSVDAKARVLRLGDRGLGLDGLRLRLAGVTP